MDTNERERTRWNDEQWTTLWPKRERFTDAITPFLLAAVALQPGERLLDIGSGGGKAAIAATEAGAIVTGADISEPLCALATNRAGDRAASFHVVDMQTGTAPGGPFDAAMSQFGVMFFDDPVAAFTNIRGHLRPGGRLAFACWQGIERNPWFYGAALMGIAPPPPPPAPGKAMTGPFTLGDPAHVEQILTSAGFTGIAVVPHDLEVDVPEDSVVDDAQLTFIGVPADRMDDARQAVGQYMARFRQPSGLSRFPLAFQIVTAVG